mmetsp:Transcript_35801/g.106851  ORF Transcript_35801/g.106851 Transcript_35801/m.106851 type:complete len:269 (-) Transcript_35801:325-1131(-)|eukprot:CAMPEP_0113535270 /NCGR_PEP_ID=MMETSP0015_2-20120614/5609_1 /TAXON_ID=2838 /ORGANISM="Odontella" /LENGTH=268 /DNA_ID=CAMNT_0000434499 /DNA_START=125 /DNA_END=931 /DNA_ORIENTATION=+ /assembly_acc=CAM_ASM_000160
MPPSRASSERSLGEASSSGNEDRPTSVSISVGGTQYQVSRSLLEQHPDVMITRMASETWHSNPKDPLFIERDGERFRYVLDYMRDGQVSLPGGRGVTKTSILNDLTYYGFSNVNPECIRVEFSILEAPKYISRITEDYEDELRSLTQQRDQLNIDIACATVAHASCARRMTSGHAEIRFSMVEEKQEGYYRNLYVLRRHVHDLDFQVIEAVQKIRLQELPDDLNKALSKYGLQMLNYKETQGNYSTNNGSEKKTGIYAVTLTVSSLSS